jgi:FtsH-binding integral membrane protein
MPDSASNPAPAPKPHNWTLVAAGLLLLVLAIVVIYTSRTAFSSPLALVVVAAIGLAALMLQLRLRKDLIAGVRAPIRINVAGLVLAIASVVADIFQCRASIILITALGSVFCFAISGTLILHALRKPRP